LFLFCFCFLVLILFRRKPSFTNLRPQSQFNQIF
jgi:hypothetical protein